ncbi:MAG TPA: FixH family protein [Phototrophicaceae bacterium]|nr:FixH family protein [Phototrophicaceae bacterium]
MRKLFFWIALLLLVGCQSAAPTPAATSQAAQIALTMVPAAPTVGTSTLTIVVTHNGQPISNAQVDARGDMNMAGMPPLLGSAKTDAQGEISLPFTWSMSGDWVVTVTVTLADKSQVTQTFNLTVNS